MIHIRVMIGAECRLVFSALIPSSPPCQGEANHRLGWASQILCLSVCLSLQLLFFLPPNSGGGDSEYPEKPGLTHCLVS